ncbi:hypothetical protein NFI96_031743, partial [Prochilodus magdalenae]
MLPLQAAGPSPSPPPQSATSQSVSEVSPDSKPTEVRDSPDGHPLSPMMQYCSRAERNSREKAGTMNSLQ